MRIGIVGSGATGGYLAAKLTLAGIPVTLVARGASLECIGRDGIKVTDPDGTQAIARPEHVLGPADIPAEPVDVALFCVKSYDTEKAAASIPALAGSRGRVLCLQNGVRNEEILANLFDRARLLSGVLYIGASRLSPGVVACTASPRLHFGHYAADLPSDDCEAIADALRAAGANVVVDSGIRAEKWQKFLFNCALNPLTALTQRPLGELLAQEAGQFLYDALLTEAIAAAQAHGAPLAADARERAWQTGRRMNILSSMAEDVKAGRPLEIDAFTGHVRELAGRYGVDTPVTDLILKLLRLCDHTEST